VTACGVHIINASVDAKDTQIFASNPQEQHEQQQRVQSEKLKDNQREQGESSAGK